MMDKQELIQYLDNYLSIWEFKDSSKNWLQVENSKKEITKIWYAVDISSYIIDKAITEKVDIIISHHGLYWWHEEVATWIPYNRLKKLINHDISCYAAHIPLDAHPEVGNNIGLIKAFVNIFGLREEDYEIESFSPYHGKDIGFGIKFKNKLHISNLVTPFAERMGLLKKVYNFSENSYFSSLGIITGGAAKYFHDAQEKWYDIFLTGESNHANLVSAKEHKQSIMLAGHYETEKIGPKLLAHHLNKKFDIETVFLDEKY